MKKYREELDQIHMSDDVKQRIRKAALEQAESQHRHHWNCRYVFRCAAVCAVIALCTGIFWMKKGIRQPEEAAQIAKSIEENTASDELSYGTTEDKAMESKTGSAQDRVVPQETYYPQTHTFMGGMGAQKEAEIQKKKIADMPYENEYTDIEGPLPVFKKLYGGGPYLNTVSKAVLQKQQMKAEKLLQTVKKTPSKMIQITDAIVDGNGDLRFILHTDKKEGTRAQQRELAGELLKRYSTLFPSKRLDIQTSCSIGIGSGRPVCETDIFRTEDNNKKDMLNQVKEGAVLSDAGDGTYYLSIPYENKLKQLREFTIMSSEEAQQVLFQGGFYTMLQPSAFSLDQLEILHVELTYGGRAEGYASYQPYVLPVYRFYTWDVAEGKPVLLEVPALYPQDLRELKENDWYFKN